MSSPGPAPVLYPAQGTQGPVLYLNPYTGTYTASRSYGLRMQRGHAAGLPQAVARRSGPAGTTPFVSESEKRRQNFLAKYGYEQVVWQRLYRKYIKQIAALDPSVPLARWRIIISEHLRNTSVTGLGLDWLENRLAEKLGDMKDYRSHGHQPGPERTGNANWIAGEYERHETHLELWWYH